LFSQGAYSIGLLPIAGNEVMPPLAIVTHQSLADIVDISILALDQDPVATCRERADSSLLLPANRSTNVPAGGMASANPGGRQR
jgi:hypothetical protein